MLQRFYSLVNRIHGRLFPALLECSSARPYSSAAAFGNESAVGAEWSGRAAVQYPRPVAFQYRVERSALEAVQPRDQLLLESDYSARPTWCCPPKGVAVQAVRGSECADVDGDETIAYFRLRVMIANNLEAGGGSVGKRSKRMFLRHQEGNLQ